MTDFPDRIYATLRVDSDGAETLQAAFFAEDVETPGAVAVYRLEDVGQVRPVFVSGPPLEQKRACPDKNVSE